MALPIPDERSGGPTGAPVGPDEAFARLQESMRQLGYATAEGLGGLAEAMRQLGRAMAEGLETLAEADERFREVLRKAKEAPMEADGTIRTNLVASVVTPADVVITPDDGAAWVSITVKRDDYTETLASGSVDSEDLDRAAWWLEDEIHDELTWLGIGDFQSDELDRLHLTLGFGEERQHCLHLDDPAAFAEVLREAAAVCRGEATDG